MRNLLVIFLLFTASFSKGQDFPARSQTIVTDYTNTLSEGERQTLENKLVAFNDSTSTQIAVVIMTSIGGYDISDYAVQLLNKWGIGQKAKNNGILILVAKEDRKVFIATGYGIEGVLPDVLCNRIVDADILPNFKLGDYFTGLDRATNSIMAIVSGEYSADDYVKKYTRKTPWFFLLITLFVIFIIFYSRVRYVRKYAHTNHLAFWAAWMLLNAANNRSRGSWNHFSGGGGFGGGGFGGGGGGFGGFGGGGSGGGGAGGSW